MSRATVREVRDEAGIRACHGVMRQLRPQYEEDEFVARVLRQMNEGYNVACVEAGEGVAAVAGYRFGENLAWGRYLYVDDLVTDGSRRCTGLGTVLLEWLANLARQRRCAELHLDSGVQRFAAHRFYLRHRLEITSHHFRLVLRGD